MTISDSAPQCSVLELNQNRFDGYLLRNDSWKNKIERTQLTDELLNGRIVKQTDRQSQKVTGQKDDESN